MYNLSWAVIGQAYCLHHDVIINASVFIKSYLLQCFGTFKMPILMFNSILIFRPEGQI